MDKNNNTTERSDYWKKNLLTFSISPRKHFRMLVSIFLLITLGILAFHSYIFYQIKYLDTQNNGDGVALPIPVINQNKLEAVLNKYDQKLKTQASVSNLVPSVVDPSK